MSSRARGTNGRSLLRGPVVCKTGSGKELHCETGPALIWETGIEEYYLKGVEVTKDVIETIIQARVSGQDEDIVQGYIDSVIAL